LVEPANVSYSGKGLLIQLSGVRQGFEFCANYFATHQFNIRKRFHLVPRVSVLSALQSQPAHSVIAAPHVGHFKRSSITAGHIPRCK
jgi:hypothetical protein